MFDHELLEIPMKKIAAKEFCDFIPPRNVGFHVELASYLRE